MVVEIVRAEGEQLGAYVNEHLMVTHVQYGALIRTI